MLDADFYAFRTMDSGAIVHAALHTVENHEFPATIREDYLASYAGDRFFESMRYARRYPAELAVRAERLDWANRDAGADLAGVRDRVGPLANAEFLAAHLPHSRLVTLDAGHFAWEEAPDEYAAMIASWVTDGRRTARAAPGPGPVTPRARPTRSAATLAAPRPMEAP